MEYLVRLILSKNRLRYLPDALLALPELEVLDLSDNCMLTLLESESNLQRSTASAASSNR
jgi:Leucine-rich repeat (LRR) protein